jgi:hypothetical protein
MNFESWPLFAMFNVRIRQVMAICFVVCGVLPGSSSAPQLKGKQ